jgi:hypothetical protein
MSRYIPDFLKATQVKVRTYTGDGSTITFTVSSGLSDKKVLVSLNGLLQVPTTNFTIIGTVLSFGTAPAATDTIQIVELPI